MSTLFAIQISRYFRNVRFAIPYFNTQRQKTEHEFLH